MLGHDLPEGRKGLKRVDTSRVWTVHTDLSVCDAQSWRTSYPDMVG
jgi:hypothetical protein